MVLFSLSREANIFFNTYFCLDYYVKVPLRPEYACAEYILALLTAEFYYFFFLKFNDNLKMITGFIQI